MSHVEGYTEYKRKAIVAAIQGNYARCIDSLQQGQNEVMHFINHQVERLEEARRLLLAASQVIKVPSDLYKDIQTWLNK